MFGYPFLLYLLVSTRAVIGQFSGPYSLEYSQLKFKGGFVAKLFCNLSPSVYNFIANKSLKLSSTLNCVLKRANDLKTISN